MDFLLTAWRDKAAARRFFGKAITASGVSEKITMDKRGANKAAMDGINAGWETSIVVRQVKCLNSIVEQDHRAIKRVTKPVLNVQSFRSAKSVLADIELMHRIRKSQLVLEGGIELSFAEQFYALAGKSVPSEELACAPTPNTFINRQCDRTAYCCLAPSLTRRPSDTAYGAARAASIGSAEGSIPLGMTIGL